MHASLGAGLCRLHTLQEVIQTQIALHHCEPCLWYSCCCPSCSSNKLYFRDHCGKISYLTPLRSALGEQILHVLLQLSVPWQHISHYISVYDAVLMPKWNLDCTWVPVALHSTARLNDAGQSLCTIYATWVLL